MNGRNSDGRHEELRGGQWERVCGSPGRLKSRSGTLPSSGLRTAAGSGRDGGTGEAQNLCPGHVGAQEDPDAVRPLHDQIE